MADQNIHNQVDFDPADYEVLDYYDNARPRFWAPWPASFTGSAAYEEAYEDARRHHEQEVEFWKQGLTEAFGSDYQKKIHKCIHCGNTRVRWIAAVEHKPTGDVVVFGSSCVVRVGFVDKKAYDLARLKSRDAAEKVRLSASRARESYIEEHPEVEGYLEAIHQPVHEGNVFAKDVLSKLNKYGTLSDRQLETVGESLSRDIGAAKRRTEEEAEVKGPAPEGKTQVTGEVVALKIQDGVYGEVLKALIKLENNSKIWITAVDGIDRGETVTVRADFTVSDTDPHFAFGKRPRLVKA